MDSLTSCVMKYNKVLFKNSIDKHMHIYVLSSFSPKENNNGSFVCDPNSKLSRK